VVIVCDKAAFKAALPQLPAPHTRRFKSASSCAKCLQKLVRRPQRVILLVNALELEALRPLIESASAPTIVIVHGDEAHRHKSATVFAVSSLEEAAEVAESRLSERVFVPPATADIRETLDIPSLFWLDDNAPRSCPGAIVHDTSQAAIRSMERQMRGWHNTCGHCLNGKRCAACNRAYAKGRPQADRASWLGETRRALVSAHLAPPLLDYLGRFPKGSGPFSEIAVYGSEALPAFSADLPLQTFSSFEQAADSLREAAEVKEEASSTGSTQTPEPTSQAQPDLSDYSDLMNGDTNSDAASVVSFADTDDGLGDLRASTPVPDDFFGPLRDPSIDFPEFHIPALDGQVPCVNSRSLHYFVPATQARGAATSVIPAVLPGPAGSYLPQPIFGMASGGMVNIPVAWCR
jgi:hypothetical protein